MIRIRIRAEDADPRNILLAALSGSQMRDLSARAVKAGLEVLAAEVRSRAPVASGRLRDSVSVEMSQGNDGSAAGSVEIGEHYAAFVEFGTSEMPARPFVRPAMVAAESAASEAVADVIRNELGRF